MLAKIFDLIHFFICDILDLLIPFSWLIGLTIINGEFWSIFITVMAMLHLFIYLHYAVFERYLFAYLMSRRHFSFGKLPVECGEQPALDGIDILVSV
ncbi:hypothetical protein DERF_005065 [Dermatophagoides farinae]|uniref:Uncharacterized protein n=1 Tax=Dermatophagoides farinae TaxID=6954 RepID=A0A922I8L8_DERFA|nr:hypothetical protein DERF_005065 [Dermatophagoides farinae]